MNTATNQIPAAALNADPSPNASTHDLRLQPTPTQQQTALHNSIDGQSVKSEEETAESIHSPPSLYSTDTPSPGATSGSAVPFNDLCKTVRPRIKPRKDQTDFLLTRFSQNGRPDKDERAQIANTLGLPLNFVTLWFQNRRSKMIREGTAEPEPVVQQPNQRQQYENAPEILEAASLLLNFAE
ncbi:UNVERIFIED_CONTAM: hypothetical protein HDU68_006650 [Siphonaria sp. JEL0065]|nr:hypothetical protein HDU68_006650 [Siphonaria sp. JEL0065]